MEITYADFEKSQNQALSILVEDWKDQLCDFKVYFDMQQLATYDILYHFVNKTDLRDCERVMFHCLIKSAHIIFTTNKLVLSGDFGIARILMRETLEYLLIGKYVYNHHVFATSWLAGADFFVKKQIWDQLKLPDTTNLKDFWDNLCRLAHSKASSVQIGNKGNDFIEVVASYNTNLMLLRIKKQLVDLFGLLEFELKPEYFSKHYKDNFANESTTIRYQEKLEQNFDGPGLDFIRDYCADWIFKRNL